MRLETKSYSVVLITLIAVAIIPGKAQAQWSLGAMYEMQYNAPFQGIGLQVEKGILSKWNPVDIRIRSQFSYYKMQEDHPGYPENRRMNFGISGIVGLPVGPIKPYAGAGVLITNFTSELVNPPFPIVSPGPGYDYSPYHKRETNFAEYFLAGLEFDSGFFLKPFVEYQYDLVIEPEFASPSEGRLVVGISHTF